jgi:hypothetical protein
MLEGILKMKSVIFGIAALLTVGMIGGVQGAYADPIQLRISDGTSSCTIADGGTATGSGACVGSTDAAGAGAISWSTTIGAWNVLVNTGFGSSLAGPGSLDLSYSGNSLAGTSTTLTIEFTQQNTTPVFNGYRLLVNGNSNGGIATSSFSAFADNSNTAFDESGGQIDSTLVFIDGGGYGLSTSGAGGSFGNNYSMTEVVKITGNGTSQATYSGDALLSPVPEPSSLVLLGSGLIGLATVVRRRLNAE